MTITRMFIISCDECGIDDADFWKLRMIERMKKEGWKFGKIILCPNCQDNQSNTERERAVCGE